MSIAARVLIALGLVALSAPAAQAAMDFSPWSPAQNAEQPPGTSSELNTPFLDGCPIQSPDGLSLYMASNRPRFEGDTRTDLDIWVASRETTDSPWGAPENLGEPVNSAADDFCPTPIHGNGLFFVSRRVTGESCGMGDIYLTRFSPLGWLGRAEPAPLRRGWRAKHGARRAGSVLRQDRRTDPLLLERP
jgi:hypothetical protein